MICQIFDPGVTSHDVILLLIIFTLIWSCSMSIFNDQGKVVLSESSKDSKEEISFRVVSDALVLIWQIAPNHRISESLQVKIFDWELFIFRDYNMDDLILFEDFFWSATIDLRKTTLVPAYEGRNNPTKVILVIYYMILH